MSAPSFIDRDLQAIIDEMIADYESRTGVTLYPAQVERLLIDTFAYRELMVREKIQYAASQNLVDFASAPILDYLGALVGVDRLAPSSASAIVTFTAVSGHAGVTIPTGTRVSSTDGLVIFETTADVIIGVGINSVNVTMESNVAGSAGNNYAVGTISVIMDPQAYISAASNISVTGGGAEQESDDSLRERIKLAPSTFSNAGSRGAYQYFALSANPSIIDVAVLGPPETPPGEVHVYPMLANGQVTPQSVLDEVFNILDMDKVRPLTDLVVVSSPSRQGYIIAVNVVIYESADATDVQDAITSSLQAFTEERQKKMGIDIMRSQIMKAAVLDGVYNVEVGEPSMDLIIASNEFAFCEQIIVNIMGTNIG